MRRLLFVSLFCTALSAASAQTVVPGTSADSDHDGLSDSEENAMLAQFAPRFMVSGSDCSTRPAEFVPFEARPVVQQENGTVYGQAFPRAGETGQVEVHYYHLWRADCGEMSHHLDAEHVSVLLVRDAGQNWKAVYWYAAAHEDTVCDASQITRAATLDAERHGPPVWVSRGKHASFLNQTICTHGCGGDGCRDLEPLASPPPVNLGELSAPMNGAVWVRSAEWPLADKMSRSDFPTVRTARVDQLSGTTIAWANPEKRPFQAAIRGGNSTLSGVATGGRATDSALDLANDKTGKALANASGSTGNSLAKTFGSVKKALGITTQKVGTALGLQ